MQPIGFLASRPHYVDHLAPIWRALSEDERAWFACSGVPAYRRAIALGIEPHRRQSIEQLPDVALVAVAGFADLRQIGRRRRAVFIEHGAGQTYEGGHLASHYPGGYGRERVALFLCPNEAVAQANRAVYPSTPARVVGSPRLDRFAAAPPLEHTGPPRVVVSFHWNGRGISPEAAWAWPHYREELERLAGAELAFDLLGHAHPNARPKLMSWWHGIGIDTIEHFDDVLAEADLFVCDNSSALYEFAALDRPVVVLDAPWYRREIEHGLRFWQFADVGVRIGEPAELRFAIEAAIADLPHVAARRRIIARHVFGEIDGNAAARAVEAMRACLP